MCLHAPAREGHSWVHETKANSAVPTNHHRRRRLMRVRRVMTRRPRSPGCGLVDTPHRAVTSRPGPSLSPAVGSKVGPIRDAPHEAHVVVALGADDLCPGRGAPVSALAQRSPDRAKK